jgi:hypothetical protein
MSKETSTPAFPIVGQWGVSERGMTLRDYFAAKAMQTMLTFSGTYESHAEYAYKMADEMLKAREE